LASYFASDRTSIYVDKRVSLVIGELSFDPSYSLPSYDHAYIDILSR